MSVFYMALGLLVALGVLVTIHEFGHFWVARRCGVKVLRFCVGFGNPLFSWRDRQGTEFAIAAIPLGGYVKMLDEREGPVADAELDQAFNRKPVFHRIAIAAAGPLANFLLALLFFWILGITGVEHLRPVIGAVEPQSAAFEAGLRPGEEILAVDGRPTAGWGPVSLQLVRRLGETGNLELTLGEPDSSVTRTVTLPLSDWLSAVEEPDPVRELGIRPWRPLVEPVVAAVAGGSPAKQAGLLPGDRIVSLDGQPIEDWSKLVETLRTRPGESVDLLLERAGQQKALSLTLGVKGEGAGRYGYLGVEPKMEWPAHMLRQVRLGPFEALLAGVEKTASMSLLTLDSLKKMVVGELSVKNLSGPITIAKVAGASAQSGLGDFLNFLAYLSISLGVLNLLPIPVLDGGHLLFYLIEWARGRPLSERVQSWGVQIGVGLVVAVMLLALINDLGRL